MATSTYQTRSQFFCWQILFLLLAVFTIKMAVSLWGYSGKGKPPMFGDFEAQRHWTEITINLPVTEWYVQGPNNDLQYWGLDYPPLTAYHMMLNGMVANQVNSSMVALETSRGVEDIGIKLFMRATVLVMDLLIFLPTAVAYFLLQQTREDTDRNILGCVLVLAGYPGLILIDNGHFQYNNVSLGLFVLATLAVTLKRDLIGAFLFCCSLNYKQMELYHALPFFAYLLGSCVKKGLSKGVIKLAKLGLVVLATFAVIWSPFLRSRESYFAVIQRLFPLKRGLYEDKVANFWCSVSVLVKFKDMMSNSDMALICLLVTSLLLLPSFIHLLRNPTPKNFHYSLINSSLVFFLFSFHVHEKSILLAAIPSCLVIKSDPLAVFWFLLISVFSMLPLLMKDALLIPTLSTLVLFGISVSHLLQPTEHVSLGIRRIFNLALVIAGCLTLGTLLIQPPQRYPDIFPLLISIFSCTFFFLFLINFHIRQFGVESFVLKITSQKIGAIDYVSNSSRSLVLDYNKDVQAGRKTTSDTTAVKHRKLR